MIKVCFQRLYVYKNCYSDLCIFWSLRVICINIFCFVVYEEGGVFFVGSFFQENDDEEVLGFVYFLDEKGYIDYFCEQIEKVVCIICIQDIYECIYSGYVVVCFYYIGIWFFR